MPTPSTRNKMGLVQRLRHNVQDKFCVVAFSLDAQEAALDIAEFGRIKRIRNQFVHGEDVNEQSLPQEQACALLRKYMRLHLEGSPQQHSTSNDLL
jgi:hypothetical protein